MKHQEREIDMKNREENIEQECTNLKNDLQSAQLQIDRLRRRLEEREIEIDKLRYDNYLIKISENRYELSFLEMEQFQAWMRLKPKRSHDYS